MLYQHLESIVSGCMYKTLSKKSKIFPFESMIFMDEYKNIRIRGGEWIPYEKWSKSGKLHVVFCDSFHEEKARNAYQVYEHHQKIIDIAMDQLGKSILVEYGKNGIVISRPKCWKSHHDEWIKEANEKGGK